jgi:hypothetical protein
MAYISKRWFDLAKRYAAGTATREEFADIPVEEALKIRGESEFVRYANVSYVAPKSTADKFSDPIRYVMISEHAIGNFKDLPLRDGMDFSQFRDRGGPFLFMHGKSAIPQPPLGNVPKVVKGKTPDGHKAWLGDVRFTPEGDNPFADMIHAAVLNGSMPAGSMGFRILESRLPNGREEKQYGVDQGSIVYDKTRATEFSAVDVGRDEKALVMYGESDEDAMSRRRKLNATIAEWREAGVYDEEMIQQFMDHVVGCESDDRFQITLGGGEWYAIDEGGRVIEDEDDLDDDGSESFDEAEAEALSEDIAADEEEIAYEKTPVAETPQVAVAPVTKIDGGVERVVELAEELTALLDRVGALEARVAQADPLIEMFGLDDVEDEEEKTTDVALDEHGDGEPEGIDESIYIGLFTDEEIEALADAE